MANMFNEIAGNLVERLFSGIVWFGIGFIILSIVFGFLYYFVIYRRKFDIRVKVVSDRAEDKANVFFDRAAILVDRKTNVKFFRLWSLRKELPVPRFNVLQNSNKGDYIELYRKGEDELYFLPPAKISKLKVVKEDGKEHGIAEQESMRMDIDLDYWAAKRKSDNKKMFNMESPLMKLLPYLPAVFTGVLMMFILYILLDHLPGILSQLQQLYEAQNSICNAATITG